MYFLGYTSQTEKSQNVPLFLGSDFKAKMFPLILAELSINLFYFFIFLTFIPLTLTHLTQNIFISYSYP